MQPLERVRKMRKVKRRFHRRPVEWAPISVYPWWFRHKGA